MRLHEASLPWKALWRSLNLFMTVTHVVNIIEKHMHVHTVNTLYITGQSQVLIL